MPQWVPHAVSRFPTVLLEAAFRHDPGGRKKERKKKEEWNWAFSRGKTAQSGHCFERTTLHSAFCGQKFKAHITFLLVSASLPTASTLVARGNLKHDRQYFPLVPCLRVTQARSRLNEKQERGRRKRICANSTYVAEKGTKKKITEERDLHLRKVEVLGSFSFFFVLLLNALVRFLRIKTELATRLTCSSSSATPGYGNLSTSARKCGSEVE